MLNRFKGMSFRSPSPARVTIDAAQVTPKNSNRPLLTPIMEELSNLRVTSTPQHRKQSKILSALRDEVSVGDLPSFHQSDEAFVKETVLPTTSRIEALRNAYKDELGEKGMYAWEL
jgi:hypothetical protein